MAASADVVRGFYAALERGDVPGAFSLLSPKISWTEAAGFPYGGTYIGPQAVLENVFAKLNSEWEGFAGVPEQFVAEGDTVVVLGRYRGKYRATGKQFDAPFAHVWTVENGRAVTFRQLTDTALAREALQ